VSGKPWADHWSGFQWILAALGNLREPDLNTKWTGVDGNEQPLGPLLTARFTVRIRAPEATRLQYSHGESFDQQDLIQAQRSGLLLMEDSLPCRGAPRGTLGKERSPPPLWPRKHPSEGGPPDGCGFRSR